MDCDTCIFKTNNGCISWDCEYINRLDAVSMLKSRVTCKNCASRYTHECPMKGDTNDDDYCSYAVRG